MAQGEVGQNSINQNCNTNPNLETLDKPNKMNGQQKGRDEEEVFPRTSTTIKNPKGKNMT
jgi:hypothetical protein